MLSKGPFHHLTRRTRWNAWDPGIGPVPEEMHLCRIVALAQGHEHQAIGAPKRLEVLNEAMLQLVAQSLYMDHDIKA